LAIDSVEKRILVLAGAGSGKTKTLIDKIRFYINEKRISAKNILTITFTKDAAYEILDRLNEYADKTKRDRTDISAGDNKVVRKKYSSKNAIIKNLNISTFHGFCYSVLKENGASYFDNRFKLLLDKNESSKLDADIRSYSQETIFSVIRKSVISACQHDERFYKTLEQYLIENYFERQIKSFSDRKTYITKEYRCLNGAIVKSKSEQKIVDWFYCKGYEVEYEPLEVASSFVFRPDIKLSEKEFYIEHKSELSSNLDNKLKALKDAGKVVFVTREEWMQDSEKIEVELMGILNKVLNSGYNADFSKEFDNKFRFLNKELQTFFKEVKQVYDLAKSQNLQVNDINSVQSDLFKHHRIKMFYELLPVVWNSYDDIKRRNSLVDFNDLISHTLNIFKTNEDIRDFYRKKFRCVLIDEFQDVNPAQVELIKYLISEDTELFCVGDDWQSIYGFRGSDVNYIINFREYFPEAQIFKLKYNFRSSESIIEVGNEIIKNNRNRVEKEVLSVKKGGQKVVLLQANSDDDIIDFIKAKINCHLEDNKSLKPNDIMILGRRNDHISYIREFFKNSGIRFSTIHKAKGQEASVVFIAGLKHGYGGFPDTWLSDSIYQVLKKTNKDILLEEERRLFYVAITRAKDFLYLLTENENQSQFIDELPEKFIDDKVSYF
jgi:superfamily I DNA/RNA helicase